MSCIERFRAISHRILASVIIPRTMTMSLLQSQRFHHVNTHVHTYNNWWAESPNFGPQTWEFLELEHGHFGKITTFLLSSVAKAVDIAYMQARCL